MRSKMITKIIKNVINMKFLTENTIQKDTNPTDIDPTATGLNTKKKNTTKKNTVNHRDSRLNSYQKCRQCHHHQTPNSRPYPFLQWKCSETYRLEVCLECPQVCPICAVYQFHLAYCLIRICL